MAAKQHSRVEYPVAPGKRHYNLLSRGNVYRVVFLCALMGGEDPDVTLALEAEDGSYKAEQHSSDAIVEDGHLVFEFLVQDRIKVYKCYFKGDDGHLKFDALAAHMTDLDPQPDLEEKPESDVDVGAEEAEEVEQEA